MQPVSRDMRIAYPLTAGTIYNLALVLNPASATGISVKKLPKLSIYPNPGNGSVTLGGSSEMQSIQVFDNIGRLVHNQILSGNTQTINLTLPAGIYTAKVSMKTGIMVSKLVLE